MSKTRKAVALMIQNGKSEFLILKRGQNSRYEPGRWELCGGAIDENETAKDTAHREAMEELGITIKIGKLVLHDIYSDMGDGFVWDVAIYKATTSDKPIIKEPHKCQELRWVTKEGLIKMKDQLATHLQEDLQKLGWT